MKIISRTFSIGIRCLKCGHIEGGWEKYPTLKLENSQVCKECGEHMPWIVGIVCYIRRKKTGWFVSANDCYYRFVREIKP